MSDPPDLSFLDEAARAAGCKGGWEEVKSWGQRDFNAKAGLSIIAHSRSLQKLAELEAENAWRPISEAEQKDGFAAIVDNGERVGEAVLWSEYNWDEEHGSVETLNWRWANHGSCSCCWESMNTQPVRFRPLPSPPKGPDA